MTDEPLTNELYKVWPAALPSDLCELIHDEGRSKVLVDARLESPTHAHVLNESVRKSKVAFFDDTHWI